MVPICGIAGIAVSEADAKVLDLGRVTRWLAWGIEHRGSDATGVATVSRSGRVKVRKRPVPASTFIERHKGIGQGAQTILIHTRMATQGHQKDRLNNHPIEYGNVVGIHNGHINNDDVLFRKHQLTRYGEVDSEAIFALLATNTEAGAALEQLEGGMATAWFYKDAPQQLWLAKGQSSPLCYAFTEGGSLVFASEKGAIMDLVTGDKGKFTPALTPLDGAGVKDLPWGGILSYDPLTGQRGSGEFEPPMTSKWSGMYGGWDYDGYRHRHGGATVTTVLGTRPGKTPSIDSLDHDPFDEVTQDEWEDYLIARYGQDYEKTWADDDEVAQVAPERGYQAGERVYVYTETTGGVKSPVLGVIKYINSETDEFLVEVDRPIIVRRSAISRAFKTDEEAVENHLKRFFATDERLLDEDKTVAVFNVPPPPPATFVAAPNGQLTVIEGGA